MSDEAEQCPWSKGALLFVVSPVNQEGKDEMTKASMNLQDLRRRIYVKAKAETTWRFWGMYVHVCKMETLHEAYALAKKNDGAPGSRRSDLRGHRSARRRGIPRTD